MPGANYMGGRRNIVKARAKDTISRRQKSHFGRQRLDILARGVSALKPSELANAIPSSASMMYKPSAQDIDLAHAHAKARTKLPVRPRSGGNEFVDSYIPRPVHVLPGLCSPRSRASMRAPSGPEKGKKTRSALCDALDMSDPVFMRGIMDEILAMPDLAGLGKCRQKSKSKKTEQPVLTTGRPSIRSHSASRINRSPSLQSRNQSTLPSSSSTKERDPQRPETPSSFQNSVYDISSSGYNVDFGHHLRASSIRSPLTPYSSHLSPVDQYGPDSPRADSRHNKTPPSYDDRAESRGSSHRSFPSRQRSFHDSGLSEYDAWNVPGPEAVSPSWSTRLEESYSSPRSIVQFSEVKDDWVVDTTVGEGEQGNYYDDSGFHSDEFMAESPLCKIPTVIDFGGRSSRRQRCRRQSSVYGTLFEQEDPWRTIGIILGLEEGGIKSDVNILPLEANIRESVDVGVEVPLDADHGQLFDEEFDYPAGAFAGGVEEHATWEEGDDVLGMDWYCQPSTLSKVGNLGQGQRERSLIEMPLENWSSTPMVDELHETEIDIREGSEPMLDFDDYDSCDGMLVDVEDEPHPEIDRPSMLDIDNDTCDGMPLEVENRLQDPSEIQHGRILEVPALDEVDGKFIGPSLFGEDFSSSEEE